MKESPILFSAPMVRALLAGTKTQTRRIFKPDRMTWDANGRYTTYAMRGGELSTTGSGPFKPSSWLHYCPYGQPGDRLWVRETWQVARETLDYETGGEYNVFEWTDELGDPRLHLNGDARFGMKAGLFYVADGEHKNPSVFYNLTGIDNKTILRPREITWRPSIHMPRWASRISLGITSVRVERLQDISEADAIAEGVRNSLHLPGGRFARENFAHLWWTINGDGSWESNPWVWVIEFKRVEGGAL